jgi:dTDP-4-dehydrorhamnose reductase
VSEHLLVFGAAGQVGRELVAMAAARGVGVTGATRAQADITDPQAVRAAVERHRPGVVVNAAAYTAVDRAESEPQLAAAANVEGAAVVAAACAAAHVPLVHLSTDYVFDGKRAGAYREDDPTNPLSVYGRTKAEGVVRVRAEQPHHLILRTSWVYGAHGANFLKTVLRLAAEQDELRVVADQLGCPTATAEIAAAILALLPRLAADADAAGTYHFAGRGATSRHGFAAEIVACQRSFTGRNPRIIAIASGDLPNAARRPRNGVLDSTRFATVFGYTAQPWQARVAEVVEQLCRRSVPAR